ncbi:hypothetical protein, partial [uncultured Tateyamaria sp.]|uniref:hypothetical protein n=1 Tax=uncultured Tateyamaria sp. TaxID=455651 RepID=UPI00261F425F
MMRMQYNQRCERTQRKSKTSAVGSLVESAARRTNDRSAENRMGKERSDIWRLHALCPCYGWCQVLTEST